jgi:hypothetical protein
MNIDEQNESYPVCCSDDCNIDYLNHETEQRKIDKQAPTYRTKQIIMISKRLSKALLSAKKYDMANGTPKADRIQMCNWITWVNMAMEDMKDVLQKADATAFDRES